MSGRFEIHLGEGIGPVRLGMRPDEVLAAMDEPQVIGEDWMGGNLNDAYLFHGLRLHFSDCDSSGPLTRSKLCWVVIHQREDSFLFGRPLEEWTKESIFQELLMRGYQPQCPANGDIEVPQQISLGFDEDERLVWAEI